MSAQCVMICSGKGGTGKSTVSVLLGAGLVRLGRKVLLVELDSGLRSVDIIAGVYGRTVYDIEDVLCGRCEPAKAIVPSPLYAGLSVISAPYEGGEVAAVPLLPSDSPTACHDEISEPPFWALPLFTAPRKPPPTLTVPKKGS